MNNQETINKILHKIRHTKGLEHLLEIGFGCEVFNEQAIEDERGKPRPYTHWGYEESELEK